MKGAQLPFQEYWGGAQPPFQEYWGGYSPPSPPGSYAYDGEYHITHAWIKVISFVNAIKAYTSA